MEFKFQKIKEIVAKELSNSTHQMDHVMRVHDLCLLLAQNEDVDLDVLRAAALLHDIAREKEDNDPSGETDHAILSADMAIPILRSLEFSEDEINHIKDCIISHRYKTDIVPKTQEAKILFDADKLDTVGAIGIARSFIWIGKNNAKMYLNPDNIDEYVKSNLSGKTNGRIQDKSKHSLQIEFETKLKFLEGKLYTNKAKEICKDRIKFFEYFLKRLEEEIEGKL